MSTILEEDPFTTPLPQAEAPAVQTTTVLRTRTPRKTAKPPAPAPAPEGADDDLPFDADPIAGQEDEAENAGRNLATIKTQLATYDKIETGLQELEAKYKDVLYPVETAEGMKDAQAALKAIRAPRYALEHARKAAKAPILALGRLIDGKAKTINGRLVALETPIDQQVTAQEAIEAARLAKLQERINWLTELPAKLVGADLGNLELAVRDLEAMDMSTFAEREQEAFAILGPVLNQVIALRDQAKQAEELRQQQQQREREAQRVRGHMNRIDEFNQQLSAAAMARTSTMLERLKTAVESMPADDSFEEFKGEAQAAKNKVLLHIGRLIEDRKELEQLRAAKPAPAPASLEPVRVPMPASFPPIEPPPTQSVLERPPVDPASTPTTFGYMPEAPSAEDIVQHLADHYDDSELNVIEWLSAMDFGALRARFRQPA